MGANSKVLVGATMFLIVLIAISAVWGENIISGVDPSFTPPPPPTDVISALTYPIAQVAFFFELLSGSVTIQALSLLYTFLILVITVEIIYIVRGN